MAIGKIKYYNEETDIGAIVSPNTCDRDIVFSLDNVVSGNIQSNIGSLVKFTFHEVKDGSIKSLSYEYKKLVADDISLYKSALGRRFVDHSSKVSKFDETDSEYIKLEEGTILKFSGFDSIVESIDGNLYLKIGEDIKNREEELEGDENKGENDDREGEGE